MPKSSKPLILVVEDDRFLIKAFQAKLATTSYETATANDGEEAIAFLKHRKPDLMLLDIVMPKKDGFAVLEEMQKNPAWKKIPVIILSNLGQESDREKGKALGAVDFLVKTDFSLQQILTVLDKYVSKKKTA